MEDYSQYDQEQFEPKKRHTWIIVVICLFLFGLVIWQSSKSSSLEPSETLHPKSSGGFVATIKRMIAPSNSLTEGVTNGRLNILLLGIGGPGHDGPYLSDTNMVVSIKPESKEVALISIPRDLGVKIADQGVRKINYADAYGEMINPGNGGDFARQIFSETFNQPIPYYIRVDFKAFSEIIDAVGGVDVTVPTTFTDTQFPGPDFSYRTVHFDAGPLHLDGERALTFARSRHGNNGEGSDFARARRQQMVIEALKKKLLSAGTYTNPVTLTQIFNSLTSHISTNLSIKQLLDLGTLAKDISEPVKTLVLDNSPTGFLVSTTGESGAFLLFPKTGDYSAINAAIDQVFSTSSTTPIASVTPSPTTTNRQETALGATHFGEKIEIQNGTWRAGLAARLKERLATKGFNVIGIGNSLVRPVDKTAIYVLHLGVSSTTTKAISNYFNTPVLTVLPSWLDQSYDNTSTPEDETGMKYNKDADMLIILGADTKE